MYLTLAFLATVILLVAWLIKRLFVFRFRVNSKKKLANLVKSGEVSIAMDDFNKDDEQEYGRLITREPNESHAIESETDLTGDERQDEEQISAEEPAQYDSADPVASPVEQPERETAPDSIFSPVAQRFRLELLSQPRGTVPTVEFEELDDSTPVIQIDQPEILPIKVAVSGYFDPATLHFFDNNERFIDAVALLPENEQSVTRNDVLAQYRQIESKYDKHHKLYGLNNENGRWSDIQDDASHSTYSDVILTQQLVDGYEPIQLSDWNRFEEIALELAAALSRECKLSISGEEAIKEANRLARLVDNFNIEAIMILNASTKSGFSRTGLNYVAREYGFRTSDGGIYQKFDDRNNEPIFSMADAAVLHNGSESNGSHAQNFQSVVLFSVLPRVSDPARAFEKMLESALDLGDRLNAKVVDQNDNPIAQESLSIVRQQLSDLSDEMLENGIVPGGNNARRLFALSVQPPPEDQLSRMSVSPLPNG